MLLAGKFSVYCKKKMHRTKTIQRLNKLEPIENEFKLNICLLKVCFNHFNESKFMFARTLRYY